MNIVGPACVERSFHDDAITEFLLAVAHISVMKCLAQKRIRKLFKEAWRVERKFSLEGLCRRSMLFRHKQVVLVLRLCILKMICSSSNPNHLVEFVLLINNFERIVSR
jgi:hypothetical protein